MFKKNYKIIIGIVIGIIISSIGVYAASLSSSEVTYNNSGTGIKAENLQGAIDELYSKTKSYTEYIPNDNPNKNIVKAYTYNEDSGSPTYCVTGDENTCFMTSCYDNNGKNSCKPGTIIVYKVNEAEEVRFHVVHDDGTTMTLQSQKDILDNVSWYSSADNSQGPLTALEALENKTVGWNSVNELNYSIGDDKTTLDYSSCAFYNDCSSSTYSLTRGPVKARMITMQEIVKLGCTRAHESCPIWVYNYIKGSIEHGGTSDGNNQTGYYWTLSANPNYNFAWGIGGGGAVNDNTCTYGRSLRAVIEINK